MTAPGVHDGHPALSASTTKTSKTARSELFITWLWRGWVLIHAGQKLERPALRDPLIATAIRGRELHLGAVIGVACLTGCHPDQGPICGADRPRRLLLTGGPRGQGARGAVRVP